MAETTPIARAALQAHPASPCPMVQALQVRVARQPAGGLELTFELSGDLAALRLPAAAAPERAEGLWHHTCFEAFIAAGDRSYREFNFSPSGQWAAWRFDGYRAGMRAEPLMADPVVMIDRAPTSLCCSVRLAGVLGDVGGRRDLHRAADGDPGHGREHDTGHLRLALCSVIEDLEGRLYYWALRHPPGRPDFHHPGGFTLQLGSPA
jgi:hypothetical protein